MECKVRDINVHYEEAGTGRPLLVIHGLPANGRMTMGIVERHIETRSGWRRLYPDLLDYGESSVPDWLRSADDVVDILLEFMDAVAPGEQFAVAGFSWGGYLARAVVQRRLKQVCGVMLGVPAMVSELAESDRPTKPVIRQDAEFVAALQPGEEWLVDAFAAQNPATLQSLRDNFLRYATQPNPEVFSRVLKPFSFDPDILPEPCPAPTVIVAGRQDIFVGYRLTWSILENFPRATLAILDRAGHALVEEQSTLWRAFLNEWLDRVEEFIAKNDH